MNSDSGRSQGEMCSPSDAERVPQLPRFRVHRRTRKSGSVVTYYSWDGRARGIECVPLGKELTAAIEGWRQCEQGIIPPHVINKPLPPRKMNGKRRRLSPSVWDGLPAWLPSMFLNAERRALGFKAFSITPTDLRAVWDRCGGCCEVSGIPFELAAAQERRRAPFAPSLDRIDSSAGYVPGNVRLVCLIVNVAMSNWGEQPLRQLAETLLRTSAKGKT
jgi:hypothetical protein